jgi:hypothetical protein
MNDENSTPAALRRLNASPAASQLMLNPVAVEKLLRAKSAKINLRQGALQTS